MQRICVFCGSSLGEEPEYLAAARSIGRTLASRRIAIVYGGARVGLMGAMAEAALAEGGEVIGVMPRFLQRKEIQHVRLTRLDLVDSMHERKARMSELADGFISLPGGLGTLEELFEVLTWGQLGLHQKPCGVLNVNGYFDPLLTLLDRAVTAGFLRQEHRALLHSDSNLETLLGKLDNHVHPSVEKWLRPGQT
jgi:uncharacterized protein (TIGR00730 family)